MPQMNLSTLNGAELRRLLDSSRSRGDAPLAYQILQEMAVRRDAKPTRGKAARRDPEPHIVDLNLGDPLEPEDDVPPMPNWRPPTIEAEVEAAAAEPVREPEPPPPFRFRDVEPDLAQEDPLSPGDFDLRLHPPPPRRPPSRGRFRAGVGAGLAVGVAVGAGLGWWAGATGLGPPPAAPPAAPVQMAQLDVVSTPAVAPVTTAAEPEPAAEPAPEPALAETPTPSEAVVETEPPAEAIGAPHTVVPKVTTGACAAEPTPADREICADPELQRLQRELRQAYADALDAHEDRDVLRQRQLAWRDARNAVTDPGRLTQLYEQRIRKLNAATAEALRQR